MKNKRGGLIITTLFIIIILTIIGIIWLINYLDIDTRVSVDLSKKDLFETEAKYCINNNHRYELRINPENEELYGMCIDLFENECLADEYYKQLCELIEE